MTTDKNLSEKLFKPQFNYPETSSLVGQDGSGSYRTGWILDGESRNNWYRVINRLSWHLRGLPLIEVDEVLSRITASTHKRSNDKWLDTVIGYQSGNWIYEFLAQAVKWQQQAEKCNEIDNADQSKQSCHTAWLTASLFASLAAYPYYRNDELSSQAQMFANRYYREALNHSDYQVKELNFTIENKMVKAILHTPLKQDEVPRAFPVVFLCAGLSDLQIDFYYYFSQYLAPLGVGLLTVDTPSIGFSKHLDLSQNTSIIHQSILEQIKTIPLIDYSKVILLGYRFGANIATRLAYLMPSKIKGIINIGPIVHQLFIDPSMQTSLPPVYHDIIANRLGLNSISDKQLMAELKFFSLKEQGLLTRPCSVPVLNIHYDGDAMSSLEEAKLVTSSKKVTLIELKSLSLKQSLKQSSAQSAKWIEALIK